MVKGTRKRGGGVKGLSVRRCTLPRVMVCQVGYNDDGVPGPRPPIFRDMLFEDLTLTGRCLDADQALDGGQGGGFAPCVPIQLEGFDRAGYELQDVTLRRIALAGGGTVQLARCKGVSLEDVRTV